MNRFSQDRLGFKMPGIDKPYYSPDFVFFHKNGIIACSPRRLQVREFKKVRCARNGWRHVHRKLPRRLWEPF